jgi:hypothetical protein
MSARRLQRGERVNVRPSEFDPTDTGGPGWVLEVSESGLDVLVGHQDPESYREAFWYVVAARIEVTK